MTAAKKTVAYGRGAGVASGDGTGRGEPESRKKRVVGGRKGEMGRW